MDKNVVARPLVASLAIMLTACSTNPAGTSHTSPDVLSFDVALFGERPEIVGVEGIFDLSDSQELAFLNFFHDPAQQETPPHERVYDYLLLATSDFDFHSDTRTAAQTLEKSSGNCLSLAILTSAFADVAGVETGYQLLDSTPVFERRGGVVSKTIHVRSILYDPAWQPAPEDTASMKRPGIQFDYFPDDTERARLIGNLTPAAYVAMYYSNVAGEAIATGDINSAFWYLLESLKQEPENPIALNMLAIVYRRAGDEMTAEQIYKYGIAHLPENVSFFRNYHYLLKSQGRTEEAEEIGRSLARLNDNNPFNWVNVGRSALKEGEYREAIEHFERALEIAPYLHEAYAMMAIAHLKMGHKTRGERELRHALENTQRQSTRSLYQAKLTMFGH